MTVRSLIVVALVAFCGAASAQEHHNRQIGYYVLDGFGGVHAGNGAPLFNPATPYFGFDIARDVKIMPGGYYVLDGFGGIHKAGRLPTLHGKYWADDIFEDLELVKVKCGCVNGDDDAPDIASGGDCRRQVTYVKGVELDGLGGVWQVSTRASEAMILWTPNTGPWDHPGTPYRMHDSIADGDETPFFGFDVARNVELALAPWDVWEWQCSLVR